MTGPSPPHSNLSVVRRPCLTTMLGRPHQLVAMCLGAGLSPVWPGTAGTLAGILLFAILRPIPWPLRVLVYAALLWAGVWACGRTGRDLGDPDHNAMVFDETLAMSLTLEFVPRFASAWVVAFLLFRLFDVTKPWPVNLPDRHAAGSGLAVMLDDLLAAVYAVAATLAVLAFARSLP